MKTLKVAHSAQQTSPPKPTTPGMFPPTRRSRRMALFAPELLRPALRQAFIMLRPDIQWANPVMFVVEVGAFLTLLFVIGAAMGYSASQVSVGYFVALDVWLFLTVL